MPLPKPRGGKNPEKRSEFLSRCHGDPVARKEFEDPKQLSGYCYSAWERKKETAAYVVQAGEDEILYTKSTVYLSEALREKMKGMPESGPGYHRVKALYPSGRAYMGVVKNCEEFETDDDEIEDEEDEMEDIEMEDTATVYAAKNDGKTLNKPFRLPKGSSKKFGVYVKNDKGNVVVVKFGDPNMSIKRDDPERRSNFRSRHGCDNPGPKTSARYWSCFMWRSKPVSDIVSSEDIDWENLPEHEVDASIPVVQEDDI